MKSDKPDISRLIDFHRLLVQFQDIERVVHVPGERGFRHENDTEHSYNLALAAWFLAEHFPHLDRDKVIRYALAHDLVEVHAGDTYIYADPSVLATKAEREANALKRLKKDWPDFPAMTETIHAYEQKADSESCFVYALDKIMPMIVVFLGKGHTWQKERITIDMLDEVKRDKVKLSPEIDGYYQQLYELLQNHLHYFTGETRERPSQQG